MERLDSIEEVREKYGEAVVSALLGTADQTAPEDIQENLAGVTTPDRPPAEAQ